VTVQSRAGKTKKERANSGDAQRAAKKRLSRTTMMTVKHGARSLLSTLCVTTSRIASSGAGLSDEEEETPAQKRFRIAKQLLKEMEEAGMRAH
jgi:hypothetical protein